MNNQKPTIQNRSAELMAQREINDAAARARTVSQAAWTSDARNPASDATSKSDAQNCASPIPAQAGTLELRPGEVYAGVCIWVNGNPYHLILSAEDRRINGIYEAEGIVRAMEKNIDLPTYVEMTILLKRLPGEFQPALYHTGDEEEFEGGTMPVLFDATPAGQRRRDEHELRLRSIRRVWADANAVDFEAIIAESRQITADAARSLAGRGATCAAPLVECFISAAEVAAVATRLIDEAARDEESEEPPTPDEHLTRAGIMTGICSMAMEIQALLASKRKAVSHG